MNNYQKGSSSRSPTFTGKSIPPSMLLVSGVLRLLGNVSSLVKVLVFLVVLHTVDAVLLLGNTFSFKKSRGTVTPKRFSPTQPPPFLSNPFTWMLCTAAASLGENRSPNWLWAWASWKGTGYQGDWPEPRLEKGWSRSPCAALNALANQGVLPRNGRHITPMELSAAISRAYNLAPTLAIQLVSPFEPLWRDRGWIDLEASLLIPLIFDVLLTFRLVQHDGSFTREDVSGPHAAATVSATQGAPSERLLNLYFPEHVDKELTLFNHAKIQAHVRATARAHNPGFVFNPLHHIFAAGNSALSHTVIGGKIERLRAWYGADGPERLLSGWESEAKDAWGVTILQAQLATAVVELAAGPLDGQPRMQNVSNGVEAQDGYCAMLGETGEQLNSKGKN
ncbi:hypothetical protein JCM8547_001684 [Rhodosporidiobolus lusitaniae]